MKSQKVLLTGASGYVGGRILPVLEEAGHRVRAMARHPEFLESRIGPGTEAVAGDVADYDSLCKALQGIDVAYYLVHCMGSKKSFERLDRLGAVNFAKAARECGVKRVIYLGGLCPEDGDLSPHLASRREVGRILREQGVPTIELRASIVIGSGSLSFELIRALTEKLPFMIMPRWVGVAAQPIGIEDLVRYLVASLAVEVDGSEVIEIGGRDQLSYQQLMEEYAKQRGLTRWMLPVPILTPWLSSLWLGLVTPVYARIGRKLVDSMRHPTVVTSTRAAELFDIAPRSAAEAMAAALRNEDSAFAATKWSDALSAGSSRRLPFGAVVMKERLVDSRVSVVDVAPEHVFQPIANIGGDSGWYACNFLWRLRGLLDLVVGGVGLRRGRPAGRELAPGDPLDFWRVEVYDPPKRLRLVAEMRLPGTAWLDFEVEPTDNGTKIHQTAIFYPHGLFGRLYWFSVYPLHVFVFGGMIREISRRARQAAADAEKTPAATAG